MQHSVHLGIKQTNKFQNMLGQLFVRMELQISFFVAPMAGNCKYFWVPCFLLTLMTLTDDDNENDGIDDAGTENDDENAGTHSDDDTIMKTMLMMMTMMMMMMMMTTRVKMIMMSLTLR